MTKTQVIAGLAAVLIAGCVPKSDLRQGTPHPRTPMAAALPSDVLVFDSDRSGNFELYRMALDGSQVQQLTSDPRFDSWWGRISPDKHRILFYRTPKGVHDTNYDQASLWLMNADGTEIRELRPRGTDGWALQGHAEWSPDGAQLVMIGGPRFSPQIFITDAMGRHARPVKRRPGSNLDPSWSPDGRTIVFVGCPRAICFQKDYEIYTMPASGQGPEQRLTSDELRDHDPYYAPDGRAIAWLTQATPAGPVGTWGIRVAASDGSGMRWVLNDQQINSKPDWSADGLHLYFHRLELKRGSRSQLFSIRPDGSDLQSLTADQPGQNEYPDYP